MDIPTIKGSVNAAPHRTPAWLLAVCAAAMISAPAFGQEDDQTASARSRQIATLFEFVISDEQAAQLTTEPVLNYTDPARVLSHASCWLWTDDARPVGALAIEFNPSTDGAGRWTFEGVTLRSGESVLRQGDAEWSLSPSADTPIPISDLAERPASDRSARLTQMKLLARRFSVSGLSSEEGRTALRLLPRPVYRYPETAAQVIDGAVFVFTYGTNPEALLVIEAAEYGDGTEWSCRVAPLTASRLTVSIGDEHVSTEEPYTGPGSRPNYVNGPVEVGAELLQFQQVRPD